MSGRAPNPNCLVTRTLGVEPYERCAECRLSTWQCLGMQYNVAVLFIFGGALVLFLTQTPWLRQAALTAILIALVVFGVTVNRQTDRTMQAARRLREEIARQKNLEAHLIQTEKLSAIGRLSAGVAHELNNALTPIIAYSEILEEQTEGKARESVGRIRQAAGRARQIVDSLLRFGRPTPPIRASVDTAKLVEETMAMVRYSFTTRGIDVSADLAPDLPPVFADATQIEQVLLNLLNNARDAMDKTPSPHLTIRAAPKGACVRIELANNGPPIPPEILPRIFDPFFTTKEVGRGTGLGLALTYGIIRDHGGPRAGPERLSSRSNFRPPPEDRAPNRRPWRNRRPRSPETRVSWPSTTRRSFSISFETPSPRTETRSGRPPRAGKRSTFWERKISTWSCRTSRCRT